MLKPFADMKVCVSANTKAVLGKAIKKILAAFTLFKQNGDTCSSRRVVYPELLQIVLGVLMYKESKHYTYLGMSLQFGRTQA